MGAHVGFESWVERDNLMMLDFDPTVIAVSSQPFWLFWAAENGKVRSHAPARLVDALREVIDAETDTSTGTRSRLMRRAVKRVEELHGVGEVPLPGRSTFYALMDRLTAGKHTFGSAVTRRQTANRPAGMFTPTFAARPGEQVQIDSTPIDVMVLLDDGLPVRADMTIAVDVATRTVCAAVLRPVGTKAVDAALLLAKMLVPEAMRPGWANALRLSASRMPHARLLIVDARMREAATRPVIVSDQIVIDHGRVFVSETFDRACNRLGISVQPARKDTPTDKGVVEATHKSIKTLFAQHVAGYTGANPTLRGRDLTADTTSDDTEPGPVDYIRPTAVGSDYLDRAVSPAPWPARDAPSQPRGGRPLLGTERPKYER
jgi:putative transposase